MADAKELLYSNLHEVFSERDSGKRRTAIERTYSEDVRFIDPEGEVDGKEGVDGSSPSEGFSEAPAQQLFRCPWRRRFGAAASTKRPPLQTSVSYRWCNRSRRAGLRILRRRPPDVHAAESRA